MLIYIRRCDWPQINWYIFLGAAFFLVGFMLQIIAPQESFDFERNLQYKVFHLQSHCIFVLLMSYGALALMVYLHELMPEVPQRFGVVGFGPPALFLSLLPLWSNFDACSQASHWFGYFYGADMMRDMAPNAVYYGGSDPGPLRADLHGLRRKPAARRVESRLGQSTLSWRRKRATPSIAATSRSSPKMRSAIITTRSTSASSTTRASGPRPGRRSRSGSAATRPTRKSP